MVTVQKDVFWKAGIITLVVFLLGVSLGYFMEKNRIDLVKDRYRIIELEWADAKMLSLYYQVLSPELCNAAIEENIKFADRVYQDGLILERYDTANQLTNEMKYEKKRYALLKVEFWINSINLKKKCNADYINLLYFYQNDPSLSVKSEQDTQSIILKELKEQKGSGLMLIPLPVDMDIASINVIKNTYNITKTPTLFIDERIKFDGVQSLDVLKTYFSF